MNRTVGPDLHDQLVVIGLLPNSGFFNFVANSRHRAENSIDWDNANFVLSGAVLCCWDITATVLDNHFHHERSIIGQRRDHMISVDHFDISIRLDIGTSNRAGFILFHRDDTSRFTVIFHDQRFHIQHDVGDIFQNPRDCGKLVLRTADLDLSYSAAFKARK